MKLYRLRILQAAGIGAVIMFSLYFLTDSIYSMLNLQLDFNLALILVILPAIIIGQVSIGYWIGRHIDSHLFLHVFLTNTLIVAFNYIINYIAYGILNTNPGSALVVTVILAWPTAVFVKKRRLRSG
jgi:hypothetical protein